MNEIRFMPEASLRVPHQRRAGVAPHDVEAVQPPSDDELYLYLGPQQRWIQGLTTLAFVLAGISLASFAAGSPYVWPLFLVLGLNVAGMILSVLTVNNRRAISARSHRELTDGWLSSVAQVPSVDVFLPTCGEDLKVLRNTYMHVAALRWPGRVEVWVLDDADRPEVRHLAGVYGFSYVVRPNRGHMKKAGNLQHAYGLSEGEHIAIFDADFCPRPDYLLHLVPYLDDGTVGIVQSPQYFSSTRSMNWLERTAGATQELFYRWIQPARDAVNGAICVGTCAVYRREALAASGGFPQIDHSEDVYTGIRLAEAGYLTKYVPIVVSKGLCPDQLPSFLNQQYRWCNGSISLMRGEEGLRGSVGVRQRMCFWSGYLYYVTTAINVFALQIPGLVMAIAYPGKVSNAQFVPFLAGLWVYFALMPRVSHTRWRVEVLRVQMAYSFAHAVAITHQLTGRTRAWVATGATSGAGSVPRTISRLGAATIAGTLLLFWGALGRNVLTFGPERFLMMAAFLGFYTYVTLPLLTEFLRVLGWLRPRSVSIVNRDQHNTVTRLTSVEFAAISVGLGLVGLLGSGLFDVALPWT